LEIGHFFYFKSLNKVRLKKVIELKKRLYQN